MVKESAEIFNVVVWDPVELAPVVVNLDVVGFDGKLDVWIAKDVVIDAIHADTFQVRRRTKLQLSKLIL